jgi:hypothetical protein|tara:strand:+ start:763 stop:996 length:234 start_codon:yes stop_codon:yes gene_type:complete
MEDLNNAQPTITIDDETYLLEDLHVEAQAMVARIQALRSQQQQLQMQLIENERAINGWAADIKDSIQIVENDEEVVQ